MVVHHKKKYRKYLGTRYARRGKNDRNRGKGNKGGKGFSGWRFKKTKYIKLIKEFPERFIDKKGFTSPKYNIEKTIVNLRDIEEYFNILLEEGLIRKEGDYYEIDLEELGIEKLLGGGNISRKVRIYVKEASENAIEKVKALGGEVVIKQ